MKKTGEECLPCDVLNVNVPIGMGRVRINSPVSAHKPPIRRPKNV